MKAKLFEVSICFLLGLAGTKGYEIDGSNLSLTLTDVVAEVSHIETLFVGENVKVTVDGLEWKGTSQNNNFLEYVTSLNGEVVTRGEVILPDDTFSLPDAIFAGELSVSKRGKNMINVEIIVSDSRASASLSVVSVQDWMSIIPLMVTVLCVLLTARIEFSLAFGTLVGSCMVSRSLSQGFKNALNMYLLGAATDASHMYM